MLALEKFAKIRAEIERTGDRDAALVGAGIDAREWIRVQRHWLRELAEEVETGGTALAALYCDAYAGSPAAIAAPAPELPAPPVSGAVVTPSYLAAAAAAPRIPVSQVIAPVVGPPIVAEPPPAASKPPFAGTAMVFELPRGPAMPFREGPPAPSTSDRSVGAGPGASPARDNTAAAAPSGGQASVGPVAPSGGHASVGPVAPSGGHASVGTVSPGAGSAREAPPARSGGTAMVFELPRMPATPFPKDALAEPHAQSVATGTPTSPNPGAQGAPQQSQLVSKPVGSGTALDTGLHKSGPSTPFAAPEVGPFGLTLQRFAELAAAAQEPSASHEEVMSRFGLANAPFAEVDAAWKTRLRANAGMTLEYHRRLTTEIEALATRRREASERPKRAGKTVPTPIHPSLPTATQEKASGPVASPPMTASGPVAAPAPTAELTVEQYAWVVATLRKAASPGELAQALARFRLTAESKRQLEERWRERMAADPALQARFLALLTGHLRGSGP